MAARALAQTAGSTPAPATQIIHHHTPERGRIMGTTYETRAEAVLREITLPLNESGIVTAEDFDVEAIADEVIAHVPGDFVVDMDGREYQYEGRCVLAADHDEFWASVARHERG
jgi:hypothetical protein